MNKKILGSGVAVVAAAALLTGGTFAAWSDWDTIEDNSSGADHLTLDLNGSGIEGFSNVKLAPGVEVERQFVVASRDGETVPAADLYISMEELVGKEDGCRGNSEREEQEAIYETTCDAEFETEEFRFDEHGQFIKEARINITSTNVPTDDLDTACNSTLNPRGGRLNSMSLQDFAAKDRVSLLSAGETLGKGEGVCVGVVIQLPQNATNASQGDSASFDLRFDLEQAIS
ncbi:TasA family protein [Egicoccus sp. AB-alg2]|uniref:TasA family protein n=1 Tax=Egicoccus sp. AB-alg2 TaxID=3242693 RepID=UPI00359D4190